MQLRLTGNATYPTFHTIVLLYVINNYFRAKIILYIQIITKEFIDFNIKERINFSVRGKDNVNLIIKFLTFKWRIHRMMFSDQIPCFDKFRKNCQKISRLFGPM